MKVISTFVSLFLFVSLASTSPVTFQVDPSGYLRKLAWNGLNMTMDDVSYLGNGLTFPSGADGSININAAPQSINGNTIVRATSWGTLSFTFEGGDDVLHINISIVNNRNEEATNFHLYPIQLNLPGWKNYDGKQRDILENNGGSVACPIVRAYTNPGGPQGYSVSVSSDIFGSNHWVGFPYEQPNASDKWLMLVAAWPGSNTHPDWLPVPAQGVLNLAVTIRFSTNPVATFVEHCADKLREFNKTYPYITNWPDRRMIGMDIQANVGLITANNPHGWHGIGDQWQGLNQSAIIEDWRRRMMSRAQDIIDNMKLMNGQGILTWDITGGAFYSAAYDCDPRIITEIPEANAVADEYYAKIRNAGIRVGMCIRPQNWTAIYSNGKIVDATNEVLPSSNTEGMYVLLRAKVKYCVDRWNATMFHIDSSSPQEDWHLIPRLTQEFPDVLFVPEHETLGSFTNSAPWLTVLYDGEVGTPAKARFLDPRLWGVIRSDFANMTILPQLINAVSKGDAMMRAAQYLVPSELEVQNAVYSACHRPPTSVNKTITINKDQTKTLWLEATDPDNGTVLECTYNCYITDQLTFKITKQPTHGTFTVDSARSYFGTFTPSQSASYPITDTIEFTVTDGEFVTPGTVVVRIVDPNAAPIPTDSDDDDSTSVSSASRFILASIVLVLCIIL